jgi:hypothetical protein
VLFALSLRMFSMMDNLAQDKAQSNSNRDCAANSDSRELCH